MPWNDMGAGLLGQEKFDEMNRLGPAKTGGPNDLGSAFAGRPLSEAQLAEQRAGLLLDATAAMPSDAELEDVREAARHAPDEDELAAALASEAAARAADEAEDMKPAKRKR